MHKVLSVEYEVAHQLISNLLKKNLIFKAEFEAIDKENLKPYLKKIHLLINPHRAIITIPGRDQG